MVRLIMVLTSYVSDVDPLDLIRPNHAGQFELHLHVSQTKQVILASSWIDMVR